MKSSGFHARPLLFLLVSATALTAACTDSIASSGATARDSAGIRIVESAAAGADVATGWSVAAEPSLTIGVLEGSSVYQLYQATGVTRLPDRRIAVANAGTGELRLYGPAGVFLGSTGRLGDGPGEFRAMGLTGTLPGDSLLVYDSRARRFSVLSSEPAFGRSFGPETGGKPVALQPQALVRGGPIVALGPTVGEPEMRSQLVEQRRPLAMVGLDGAVQFTGDTVQAAPWYLEVGDGGIRIWRLSFAPGPVAAGAHDGFFTGDARRYELRGFHRSGELRTLIRLNRPPRPVTERDRDAALQRRLDNSDEANRAAILSAWDAVPEPEVMPAHGSIEIDPLGNLWVEEYRPPGQESPRRWLVFDPDGALVGHVELPPDLIVREIGEDYVLGFENDELGVQRVAMYELDR